MLKTYRMAPNQPWCYELDVHYRADHSAYFRNAYCPKYGVVDARSNYKPKVNNVERWSDVVWYFWEKFCETENVPVSHLGLIYRDTALNDHTDNAVDSIMDAKGYPDEATFDLPFTPQDPDFYALVGLPHVIGVLHLLADHKEKLNGKSISRIILRQLGSDLFPMRSLFIELSKGN